MTADGLLRAVVVQWRQDLDRYVFLDSDHQGTRGGLRAGLRAFLANPGIQAGTVYRLAQVGHVLRSAPGGPWPYRVVARVVGGLLGVVHPVLSVATDVVTGIRIDPGARIGGGLYIGHSGGIVIGPAQIGRNCNIAHGVTIGSDGIDRDAQPTIGDRVLIAAGAKVFGRLSVGPDAMVGANSVVTKSVPARHVVLGIPAVLVNDRGAFAYVRYRGCDTDPDRLTARSPDRDPGR
jgi:serine O-acetyltransferase